MRNIEDIICKIEKQAFEKGNEIDDKNDLILSEDDLKIISNLYKTFSCYSSVYDESELEGLKRYRVPDSIADFYMYFLPRVCFDFEAGFRFLSIKDIKRECSEYAPSAFLIRYGVITIGTTIGGNAICIDLNKLHYDEPRVIIADHSIFSDKTISVFHPAHENFELSHEIIDKFCPEVSSTFFLF